MKGLRKARTVAELKAALAIVPDTSVVKIMPEDGPAFTVQGVLQFTSTEEDEPSEVWLLMNEWENEDDQPSEDDDETPDGDVVILRDGQVVVPEPEKEKEEIDCVEVRGLLRTA